MCANAVELMNASMLQVKEQLQQARGVADHVPAGQFLESRRADLIRNLVMRQFLFIPPDHGDFRDGVDPVGQQGWCFGELSPEHM